MKKILLLVIVMIGLLGCDEIKKSEVMKEKYYNSPLVMDNTDKHYRVVTIEGCEFYLYSQYRQMGLSKVDCNCVADTTGRK
jgi:hypothetical protein